MIPERNDAPEHIAALVTKIGLTQKELCEIVKCDPSNLRGYKTHRGNKSARKCPYHLQVILEFLAAGFCLHESAVTNELS